MMGVGWSDHEKEGLGHHRRDPCSSLLFFFFIFALLFVFLVPVYESPDEPNHLAYLNFVSRHASLPNQYDPKQRVGGEGHQPPLYYLLGALLCRLLEPDGTVDITPIRNEKPPEARSEGLPRPMYKHLSSAIFASKADQYGFYCLRIFSVLISLLNLLLILRLTRLFLREPEWQWLPALFVATNPQFLFISASINNDNLANLLATLALYYSFRLLEEPSNLKHFGMLGFALGLGFLTKKTLLFLVPGLLLILIYLLLARKGTMAQLLKNGMFLLAVVLLLSGWMLIRNFQLYGEFLGTEMEKRTLHTLVEPKSLFSPYFYGPFFPSLYLSFIARFGWMYVGVPKYVYFFHFLLHLLALGGLFLHLKEKQFRDVPVGFALLFVFLCFAGIVWYNLTYTQSQGRFLFPTISLMAILFTLGVRAFLSQAVSRSLQPLFLRVLVAGFYLVDVVCLLRIYFFYYRLEQYWG